MRSIDYERLYRDVLPSVVSIYISTPDPAQPGGAGSGFVFDDSGHVITNQHVVGDSDRAEVRFSRGDWRVATTVGSDVYTDLAVIRIDAHPSYAEPLPLATENPAPGRAVAAIGNPLGLDGSITEGIVSGANRSMETGNGFAIPDVVQTDAAINPGNSGGPLVAVAGDGYEVVGVNRAKQGDNIGFAVSPTIVARVVPSLLESGIHRHPYLRVRTLDVTPTVAEANGLDEPRGVLVVEAHPSIRAIRGCDRQRRVRGRVVPVGGDVIVGIDGRELRSHEELMRYLITDTSPGDWVNVDLLRESGTSTADVQLAERPPPGGTEARGSNTQPRRQVPIE